MKSGIYKITNIINNKVYVGQSKNLNTRFTNHLYRINTRGELKSSGGYIWKYKDEN